MEFLDETSEDSSQLTTCTFSGVMNKETLPYLSNWLNQPASFLIQLPFLQLKHALPPPSRNPNVPSNVSVSTLFDTNSNAISRETKIVIFRNRVFSNVVAIKLKLFHHPRIRKCNILKKNRTLFFPIFFLPLHFSIYHHCTLIPFFILNTFSPHSKEKKYSHLVYTNEEEEEEEEKFFEESKQKKKKEARFLERTSSLLNLSFLSSSSSVYLASLRGRMGHFWSHRYERGRREERRIINWKREFLAREIPLPFHPTPLGEQTAPSDLQTCWKTWQIFAGFARGGEQQRNSSPLKR